MSKQFTLKVRVASRVVEVTEPEHIHLGTIYHNPEEKDHDFQYHAYYGDKQEAYAGTFHEALANVIQHHTQEA